MRTFRLALGLGVLLLLQAGIAWAQGSTLRINESALNGLAARIEPLVLSGRYAFQVSSWTPFGTATVTICDSNYTATVNQLRFTVTAQQITVTGNVSATWCGANFNGNLNTTGDAVYRASDRSIVTTINPTSIQPVLNVLGYKIGLPIYINVGPSLSVPRIPVQSGAIVFETAAGPRTVTLTPTGVTLVKRAGYLELQANVYAW